MPTPQPLVPDVLVVHGALGSARQMAPLVERLRAGQRFASVTAIELPGHGDTPLPDPHRFSMMGFADAIAEAIAAASLNRPLVFGYSMGGYAALLLACTTPDLIGGIVTLGTMLQWTPAVATRAASRLDAASIREKVPAFAATLEERHAASGGWEQVVSRTAALLQALGDAPPLDAHRLSRIQCPVHLLVGDRDDSVTFDETVRVASQMPGARASLLHDTPHPIERVSLDVITREMSDLASLLSVDF